MLRQTPRLIPRTFTAPTITTIIPRRFYEPDNSIPDNKHTTEKDHKLDVLSNSSHEGQEERRNSTQSIPRNDSKKQDPKKDNPKAPEPVIGMQDERGGKGH